MASVQTKYGNSDTLLKVPHVKIRYIFILFLIFTGATLGQVTEQDSLALVALYNSTNGDNWTHKDNWLTGPVSTWYGITVTEERVTKIHLFMNNLSGQLPTEINALNKLEILYLRYNKINGTIPTELCELESLLELQLGHNMLSGPITMKYGIWENLQLLELSYNQITGDIPKELCNLLNLKSLFLSGNQLSGEIPPEFVSLINLEELSLNGNQLTGTIPTELGELVNLENLVLSQNNLTGFIPVKLCVLINLKTLDLSGNQLTGPIPHELGDITKLQNLCLGYNQLSGEIPIELCRLSNLTRISAGGNKLSGKIPPEFGELSNLEHLDLWNNQLTGKIPIELGKLLKLEWLEISKNLLSGPIPEEFGNLSNLGRLSLAYNQLSGPIPVGIGRLHNLCFLFLRGNQLQGSLPSELGELVHLRGLSLASNEFTGPIPAEFGNMQSLRELRLEENRFIGQIPLELTQLPELEIFHINSNKINVLPDFSNNSKLRRLHVERNQLTFMDIEPNLNVPEFIYWPQDSVGSERDTTVLAGTPLQLSVLVGGSHCHYQWKKDDAVLPGATTAAYSNSAISSHDGGTYTCEITNTVATKLTLYSRPITVHVKEKTVAPFSISCDTVQFSGSSFWVDLMVGSPEQSAASLKNLDFKLQFGDSAFSHFLSVDSVVTGDFWENDSIFEYISSPGAIAFHCQREKYPAIVHDEGTVARVKFLVDSLLTQPTDVYFELTSIEAFDEADFPMELIPYDKTIHIRLPNFSPTISMNLTDGEDTTVPGASLNYTISYQNTGSGTASAAALTCHLPEWVHFTADTAQGGLSWQVIDDSTITWQLPDLPAQMVAPEQVSVSVETELPTAMGDYPLVTTAVLNCNELLPITARDTTILSAKPFEINLSVAPKEIELGESVQLTVATNKPVAPGNWTLEVVLPDNSVESIATGQQALSPQVFLNYPYSVNEYLGGLDYLARVQAQNVLNETAGDTVHFHLHLNTGYAFDLDQNQIQPDQGECVNITYSTAEEARVVIKIYNVAGELMTKLVDQTVPAGLENIQPWSGMTQNGETVASGVYLVVMQSDNFQDYKKVIVVR